MWPINIEGQTPASQSARAGPHCGPVLALWGSPREKPTAMAAGTAAALLISSADGAPGNTEAGTCLSAEVSTL